MFGCVKELHYLCIQMDDKRYLQSLINEGEHQQQDFKYRVTDACKLAKSVSAFANTTEAVCSLVSETTDISLASVPKRKSS